MAKYRVLTSSLINFPPPIYQLIMPTGSIVCLPSDAEVHSNLELLADQTLEATLLGEVGSISNV